MRDGTTICEAFAKAVSASRDRPFFAGPAGEGRGYLVGLEITYADAAREVEALAAIHRSAGYGLGARQSQHATRAGQPSAHRHTRPRNVWGKGGDLKQRVFACL
jgi:hypothetical protein